MLFHDPEVLERTLGVKMSPEEAVEARFIPKTVLARLIERSERFADAIQLIDALDDWAVRRIVEHPLIRELEALIADVRSNPGAGGAAPAPAAHGVSGIGGSIVVRPR